MNPDRSVEQVQHYFRQEKEAWENALNTYTGCDLLEIWYNYVCWYEHNADNDPETQFRTTMETCLSKFENIEAYKQDTRMVKLWMKYIDMQPNPLNLYQILYQRNIGTQCAIFYIAWAHYYDAANALKQSESVYNLGFQAKAQPYDDLQAAHTNFQLSVAQRMLYDDMPSKKRIANGLAEQRHLLTALRPNIANKRRKVEDESFESTDQIASPASSVIVNAASSTIIAPMQTPQLTAPSIDTSKHSYNNQSPDSQSCDLNNAISSSLNYMYDANSMNYSFTEQQQQPPTPPLPPPPPSQLQQPEDQQQQHQVQHQHQQQYLQRTNELLPDKPLIEYTSQSINAKQACDASSSFELYGVTLPLNFVHRAINNGDIWQGPVCLEEPHDQNRRCFYPKHLVYPGDGSEYSPEEIRSRRWKSRQTEHSATIEDQISEVVRGQLSPSTSSRPNGALNEYRLENIALKTPASRKSFYDAKLAQPVAKTISVPVDDEQIEASTIRFCSNSNGHSKSQTITIKFKKEKSSSSSSSTMPSAASTPPKMPSSKSLKRGHSKANRPNHQRPFDESTFVAGKYNSNSTSSKIGTAAASATASSQTTPFSISTAGKDGLYDRQYHMSRNPIEDANLLLSIANMHSSSNDDSSYSYSSIANAPDTVPDQFLSTNEDSYSNSEFNASFNSYSGENSNHGFSFSGSSTPVRSAQSIRPYASESASKSSTPNHFKYLKNRQSHQITQNDDSMCSYSGEQHSFFVAENDDELKQRRIEKAIATIGRHLTKPIIDPFNTELCKAFLTKIGFPETNVSEVPYKISTHAIPKLAVTKSTTLNDVTYHIEKEVGRGAYGSVYRAVNLATGNIVALKFQKPPNMWELYICMEVRKRVRNQDILTGFMDIGSAVLGPNASILVSEFSQFGSLLDINNRLRQATTKVMHESLVMHFTCQILSIVDHLHSCRIVHADIKPDNFLLMKVPNAESHVPTLRLIDFGCAIDMTLFDTGTQFKKVIQTDGFTCTEMQEGRSWSYQTDLFCVAGTVHVMLFGEYMQLVRRFGSEWDIKQKLPRYLKKQVWSDFFQKLLNIKDVSNLPNLQDMRAIFAAEVYNMESELQKQIRTLSNLLHKR